MKNNDEINERNRELISRLTAWIGKKNHGDFLYHIFHYDVGMTNDEIEALGFSELTPYFMEEAAAGEASLLSVINSPLYNVCLKPENDSAQMAVIPKISRSMFMKWGLKEWNDILSLPVKGIHSDRGCTVIDLGRCSEKRMEEFENLMTGRCCEFDYDHQLRHESWNYIPENIRPNAPRSFDNDAARVISVYEELLEIPMDDRTVGYYESCNYRYFVNDVSDEMISQRYSEALQAMGLDEWSPVLRSEGFDSRANIISRMRDYLLADHLQIGEAVLFVATVPYGGEGDFALCGGTIEAVDAENMVCSVSGDFFTMDDIPLHYVLGRYNPEISEPHYGKTCVEPLFGEHPVLAN